MSSQESMPFKPGTIRLIKLVNFMCHESFELPLGPNVNFIIGPNGSGKSALLTALTVALGARATNTARGKRASDFIKYGAKWARVIVVIHNYDRIMNKDQAFKPDDYGKTITVEKTLYRDEASKLALKNDKDKRVSERKQELDEMMDHFGIVVNNPICILNQEVSKTFLHSKKPEDKFDLFMKATNLEQIEQDYESANSYFKEWNMTNSRKNVSFALLDKEYAACEEKINFLMQSAKLKDILIDLNREYVFAVDKENEKLARRFNEQVIEIKKLIETAQQESEKRADKIRHFQEEIQITQTKIQSIKTSIDDTRKKYQDIQTKELDIKKRRFDVRNRIENYNQKIARSTKDKKSLEKSIEDKKKELKEQDDLDNDTEQRKLEIESLERELPNDQARERILRDSTNQLSESMTCVRSELQAANLRVSELKNKQFQHQAVLRRLKNGRENSLRKYGDHVIKIREEIDRAHAAGRFKKKPIGPLGYYVKVLTPDVSGPLEHLLGKNAHAFTCDNHQDMNALNLIFKKLSNDSSVRDFRHPVIINRPFRPRHDVSKFKARHETYKTLLDHIEIEEDVVFNALVDRCFLESVLFIPEYHLAEALMIDKNAIPPNTRLAYTKDCTVMHPRNSAGGYRSFANKGQMRVLFSDSNTSHIKETEREISLLDADIRDAQHHSDTIQTRFNVQRNEYERNMQETRRLLNEMRKKEAQLLNLKTTITVQPQELMALEMEYENISNSIGAYELELEKHKESLSSLDADLRDILQEKDSCQSVIKLHEKKRTDELAVIDSLKSNITQFQQKIEEKRVIIENKNKELDSLKEKIDEHNEKLARTKTSIKEDWVRPRDVRSTDVITTELNKIRKQIEVQEEENQDPEEVVRNMKKRMEEIKSLTEVKNKNSLNFRSCEQKLSHRKEGFATLRSNTIAAVSATFSTVMRTVKMNGVLQIHLDDITHRGEVIKKGRTLEMRIDTNPTPTQRVSLVMSDSENANNNASTRSQPQSRRASRASAVVDAPAPPRAKRARVDGSSSNNHQLAAEKENEIMMTDARSLSGGERSFSTVAFVLALWHHCVSPFKLMDEIDVFMDMVTRRISYNALIRFAQHTEDPGQFIFFSPLELPKIDNSANYVRVFEMPAILRKKRPVPSDEVLGEGGDEPLDD